MTLSGLHRLAHSGFIRRSSQNPPLDMDKKACHGILHENAEPGKIDQSSIRERSHEDFKLNPVGFHNLAELTAILDDRLRLQKSYVVEILTNNQRAEAFLR